MSRRNVLKVGLVATLILVWLVVPGPVRRDGLTLLLLLFGTANAVFDAAGTDGVRYLSLALTFVGLVMPPVGGLILAIGWLIWPAAFLLAWSTARNTSDTGVPEAADGPAAGSRARATLAAVIAAVAVASLAFRLIVGGGLQQTAALFVGIPALLAIVVVLLSRPQTATGVAFKAVTVGLVVSLLFLGEGILCVVMSAPLFYLVAGGMGAVADRSRQRTPTSLTGMMLLVTVPMSLEGVVPVTTFNRDESVSETRIVRASPEAIERALFAPPRFDRALPLYLRAGFPSAIATRIERAADGVRWVIQVRGGEMRITGMEPRTGELVLKLEEARPGFVRWRAVSDTSHMTHFLMWRDITVRWDPVGDDSTQVTWTLGYERGLDPAWYFGPWERYAVHLAAGYLIETVATP